MSNEIRVILEKKDYELLLKVVSGRNKSLASRIEKGYQEYLERTAPKRTATKNATQSKINTAKAKIKKAIETLKKENRNITKYTIYKEAKISYSTIKKYFDDDNIQELINFKIIMK